MCHEQIGARLDGSMQVIYAFIFLGPYYVSICAHSKFSDIIFNKKETTKTVSKCCQCIANQLPKGAKEDKTDKKTNQNLDAAKTKKKDLIVTLLEKMF